MEEFRNRARANLSTVLLTLLSIVQALALEFLRTYIRDSPNLLIASSANALMWLQLVATLIGLVLIWVVYASHVMRLRWVPTTTDSIYPFAIGLLEFILIELLGPDKTGPWLLCYALIFALMVWVSHRTMRRARKDGANDAFFGSMAPAQIRDFYLAFAVIGGMDGCCRDSFNDSPWNRIIRLDCCGDDNRTRYLSVPSYSDFLGIIVIR